MNMIWKDAKRITNYLPKINHLLTCYGIKQHIKKRASYGI